MKTKLMLISIIASMFIISTAQAEGCLKGAAVGGVVGHFAGKHPILGAGAGCVVGQHMAKKEKEKQTTQAKTPVTVNNVSTTNNPNLQPVK